MNGSREQLSTRGLGMLTLGVLSLLSARPASAVTQPPPDSTALPQPVPTAEVSVVMARGFDASADQLSGLFALRSEALSLSADAVATPGTFLPRCNGAPVSVELVLSGGACKMALAWYNARTDGTPPATADLHVVVPQDVRTLMSCYDADFCPLAGTTTQAPQHGWKPVSFDVDVCADPAYQKGQIGFALLANTASICSATKYTQPALNTICSKCDGQPWITTLIYRSTATPDAYYLAFEDLPMSPADWRMAPTALASGADGDFNDFVFFVRGVCHDGVCVNAGGNGGADGTGAGGSGGQTGVAGQSGTAGQTGTAAGGAPAMTGAAGQIGSANGGMSDGAAGAIALGGISGAAAGGAGGAPVSGPLVCMPGQMISCSCTDGRIGAQACAADGQRFNACVCAGLAAAGSGGGCGCAVNDEAPAARALFVCGAALAFVAAGRRRRDRRGC